MFESSEQQPLAVKVGLLMQTNREQLADLAMAIFMRDPPNDPKSLHETQEHSTVKLSGLSTASKSKASKHEVCY